MVGIYNTQAYLLPVFFVHVICIPYSVLPFIVTQNFFSCLTFL